MYSIGFKSGDTLTLTLSCAKKSLVMRVECGLVFSCWKIPGALLIRHGNMENVNILLCIKTATGYHKVSVPVPHDSTPDHDTAPAKPVPLSNAAVCESLVSAKIYSYTAISITYCKLRLVLKQHPMTLRARKVQVTSRPHSSCNPMVPCQNLSSIWTMGSLGEDSLSEY